MKINLSLWIIGVLLLYALLFAILFSLRGNFNAYIKTNLPSITIAFFNILLGSAIAVGGVFWAFSKNTERAYKTQVDTFRRSFGAVISECGENQAIINKLKKEITPVHFNLQILSDEISKGLIINPMLYKYAGDEYLYALRAYLANVKLVNQMLNLVYDDFKADGNISDKNINDLNAFLDDCLYYLYILQYQSQLYVYCYDVRWGPKPGNYDEIMALLKKNKKVTIDELKAEIDKLGKMPENDRKALQDSIKKVIEQVEGDY